MKSFKDLSLAEKDILGFIDEDEDKYRYKEEQHEKAYDLAYKEATRLAIEDGIYDDIVANNDPEDVLIELTTIYPELFENL